MTALSGLAGSAVVWWLARRDTAKLRKRVEECEADRARLHEKLGQAETRITELSGACGTLTDILRKEINVA